MAHNDAPEPTWALGPLSIKRTTDILALVAFILSVIGLLAQAREYWRGANAVLFAPEQVTFGSTKALKVYFQKDEFLIVTAIMSYVNDAAAGYNAAIGREYVRFDIDGKRYQYLAHHMVSTSSESSAITVTPKDDSGPFAVSAGSAVSHEVLFEPHPVKCADGDRDCAGRLPAIRWSDFKTAVRKNPVIMVTLLADVYGKGTLSVQCRVTLNANDLEAFEKEKADEQWSGPDCYEEKPKGFWDRLLGGK